jgi:hypothetical protein
MNTQTPIVRRLLSLTLACGLLAALTPAARAQSGQPEPEPQLKGCGYLQVLVSGTRGKIAKVTCSRGNFDRTVPPSGEITPGQPVVVFLYQTGGFGPECTITVSGQKETAVLATQQNFCGLAAGEITASVVSGNAKHLRSVRGGFPGTPGMAFFALGF